MRRRFPRNDRDEEVVERPIAIRKSYDFVSLMILQLLQG